MEKEGKSAEGAKASKNGVDNTSWCRGSPHYWAEASLPLAYAVACLKVVFQGSKRAAELYDGIVKAWSEAAAKSMSERIGSTIGDLEKRADQRSCLESCEREKTEYTTPIPLAIRSEWILNLRNP